MSFLSKLIKGKDHRHDDDEHNDRHNHKTTVHTVHYEETADFFKSGRDEIEELNPDGHKRKVYLVWRAISHLKKLGKLGEMQDWSHWAVEVARSSPNR